ncbi:hypothetical protein NQ315_005407 [Exocentrus adspersus]|uniref:Peptidase aspartic putative domain-containing protein n=1 Tax=Exocentrus adspersus TaxID=1586481 RepID=A0AAV8W253_9CUCU|nr:hypothetical protein NQ315_005407 [Exocentrus adspersus]
MFESFTEVQCAIEIETDSDSEGQEGERVLFEEAYYKVISAAKKLLNSKTAKAQPTQKEAKDNTSNESKDAAAEVVQSLELSEDNYQDAWSLLKENFENKKLIALSHLDALFDFPPLTKESYKGLKKLLGEIRRFLKVFKRVQTPVETWDIILIYVLEKKLDPRTKQQWNKRCELNSFQTMAQFLEFLAHRCQYLFAQDTREGKQTTERDNSTHKGQSNKVSKSFVTSNQECCLCKEAHNLYHCKKFIDLSADAKREEIRKNNLCWNCLHKGHTVQKCTSRGCRQCGRKHNTLLHSNSYQQATSSTQNESKGEVKDSTSGTQANSQVMTALCQHNPGSYTTNIKVDSEVLLSTALVLVKDKYGKAHECRALLDSGSQSNFMTKNVCDRLQLSTRKLKLAVSGINQIGTNINGVADATIMSMHNGYQLSGSFLILNKITDNLPVRAINRAQLSIPQHLNLADPSFHRSGEIDLLFGASIFWDLLCVGQIKLGNNYPIMQKTKLGWVIAGTMPPSQPLEASAKTRRVCNLVTGINLQDQLERFWRIEEGPSQENVSKEDYECQENFLNTTRRDEQGRFIVTLPLRENISDLDQKQGKVTKRSILSITAQIFDPLGLVGPTTIKAKLMMQKLWQLKCKWDESVPLEPRGKWRTKSDSIQPGMMVLIKDENLPPLKWPLARVVELHPGKDNVCRAKSPEAHSKKIQREKMGHVY